VVEVAEAEAERECAIAAEHLKYVAEGGPAGKAVMDAYWAHWDGRSWSALIGYAWGTALGFDLAHAAFAQLLSDAAPQPPSAAMPARALLGCMPDTSKGNHCDRARVALLRRLVSPRARQGDNTFSSAGVDQVAVGRWLPAEALVALAAVAMSVAEEPGECSSSPRSHLHSSGQSISATDSSRDALYCMLGVAFELLSQAVGMGSADAMVALALLYETGVATSDLTVAPNQTMAVEL
jgi:hypothetical protein